MFWVGSVRGPKPNSDVYNFGVVHFFLVAALHAQGSVWEGYQRKGLGDKTDTVLPNPFCWCLSNRHLQVKGKEEEKEQTRRFQIGDGLKKGKGKLLAASFSSISISTTAVDGARAPSEDFLSLLPRWWLWQLTVSALEKIAAGFYTELALRPPQTFQKFSEFVR